VAFGQAIVLRCGNVGSNLVYSFREEVVCFWLLVVEKVVSKIRASSDVLGFICSVNPQ
jgi:hypothetical protein